MERDVFHFAEKLRECSCYRVVGIILVGVNEPRMLIVSRNMLYISREMSVSADVIVPVQDDLS